MPRVSQWAFEDLFPEQVCLEALAELSVWTSIKDIAAAGRILAGIPQREDRPASSLAIGFADDERILLAHLIVLSWLKDAYRPPVEKIALAAQSEPAITADIGDALAAARFTPRLQVDPTIEVPEVAAAGFSRTLLVEDEAHVVELVQRPVRCMSSYISRSCADLLRLEEGLHIDPEDEARRNDHRLYHRPHADGRLPAVMEAACFYAFGFGFGPLRAKPADPNIETGYRSVNVVACPPFDLKYLEGAAKMNAAMLAGLV